MHAVKVRAELVAEETDSSASKRDRDIAGGAVAGHEVAQMRQWFRAHFHRGALRIDLDAITRDPPGEERIEADEGKRAVGHGLSAVEEEEAPPFAQGAGKRRRGRGI